MALTRILAVLLFSSALGVAQMRTVSPIAPSDRVVVIQPGQLTNLVWESGTTYKLAEGTNTVSTYPYDTDPLVAPPHLFIRDKTNITIEGLGWNSVISTPHTGTVVGIYNCKDITIRKVAILGTRVPNGGTLLNGLIAGIVLHGTNSGIVLDDCLLDTHTVHGVTCIGMNTTNNSFTGNTFRNVGHTNIYNGAAFYSDGAAIVVPGSDTLVSGNLFENCFNGVEGFGSTGYANNNGFRVNNLQIIGNRFRGIQAYCWYNQNTAGGIETNSTGFSFISNIAEYNSGQWGVNAVMCYIVWGRKGIIANNICSGAGMGIRFAPNPALVEDWTIDNNDISDITTSDVGGYGIGINMNAGAGPIRGIKITNNRITTTANHAIRADGMQNSEIIGNTIRRSNTNQPLYGAIFTTSCLSNRIERNKFWWDGGSVLNRPAYALQFFSGDNYNIVQNNDFKEFVTAAWSDSGSGNDIRNNWVGTNFVGIMPITNSYAATNVVVNLAAREIQVLEATNSMLLIWTNAGGSTALSGKRTRVSLINNKATNMNVVHTAANLRLFGQHAGTVTNGRTLTFEVEVLGTNYNITAFQQQN